MAEMTPELHVELLNEEFCRYNKEKYLKGDAKHTAMGHHHLYGYSITELIDLALEEAVDQVNYLLTLRAKWREGQEAEDKPLTSQPRYGGVDWHGRRDDR